MSQNDNIKPLYQSYCFIYLDNNLIGYTHTHSEAKAICKLNSKYQWEFALAIKNTQKRENYYANLNLMTFSNNIQKID